MFSFADAIPKQSGETAASGKKRDSKKIINRLGTPHPRAINDLAQKRHKRCLRCRIQVVIRDPVEHLGAPEPPHERRHQVHRVICVGSENNRGGGERGNKTVLRS